MKQLVGLLLLVAGVASGQTITEFSAGITTGSQPEGITAGPDGNIWFTELYTGTIGQITPTGLITEFPALGANRRLIAGPDGNLWFTAPGTDKIGRITPAGGHLFFRRDHRLGTA